MGIDPGVQATGMVLYDGGVFRDVHTYTTKRRDDTFGDVLRRKREQIHAISLQILEWSPELLAIESFEDFGAYLREAKNRYFAPMLIGALDQLVAGIGSIPVVYQSPKRKAEANLCVMNGVVLYPGQELLTNGHLRDAAKHALVAEKDLFFLSHRKE